MYENPKFNQNNEKILCERNGKNSDMLMDIRVKILKAGETMTFCEAENETALLLMAGDVDFVFDGKTDNSNDFGVHYYKGEDMTVQHFGADQWDGTADRQVLTVFDYENAPYSNLVLGEVFHKPGCWTSYPPHYHPQPEVYYYEFDKPQGFGVGFNGDDCYKVGDKGCLCITPMHTHQQAAAPGYKMCYVWMIRHLDGDPWRKTRIDAPEHKWLLDDK